MTHTNIILISTAMVVMSAGVVVGRLSDRLPVTGTRAEQHSRSWLVDQLKLTADQRQKMDLIWADTRQQVDKAFQARNDLEKQRDQAIHDLFTSQQRAAYDKINSDFHSSRDELFKARNKLVHDANDKSRALLDDNQQKQWDSLSKEMRDHRGAAGSGIGARMRPDNGSPGERPRRTEHAGDHPGADRQTGDRQMGGHPPSDNPTTKPTGGA